MWFNVLDLTVAFPFFIAYFRPGRLYCSERHAVLGACLFFFSAFYIWLTALRLRID